MTKVSNVRLGDAAPDPSKPSEKMTSNKSKTMTVKDVNGRSISLTRVSALDLYRITKLLGPEGSANQATTQMALLASSVTAIGSESIKPPSNEREIEAILQMLDFEGFVVVQKAMAELGEISDEASEAAKN